MKIKGDKLSATATMKIKHDYMHMDFMEMNQVKNHVIDIPIAMWLKVSISVNQ